MDSLRFESKPSPPVVLHRIRRHSHTVTGVPIPGISADGIGSPTDHAHTPPGVLTKIDSIQTKKPSFTGVATFNISSSSQPPKKMYCRSCNKKINCWCKKCTLEKVKLYSRRENLMMRFEERERLQTEINNLIAPAESLKLLVTQKEERLISLRQAVENAKMRVVMKQAEGERMDAAKIVTAAQFSTVFSSQTNCIAKSIETKQGQVEKLKQLEEQVARIRKKYCFAACRIFPVQIYDVNVESVTAKTQNPKNWAMVNDSELQKGLRTIIRNSYINDKLRAKLAKQLSNGPITLPLELHPPFAAFTNTLQLVHLLSVIFNFRAPETLSHHDLCIRDRWTKDSLDRDWATLCDAVIYLSVFIGLSPTRLKYSEPHHNLIEIAKFVVHESHDIRKIGSRPAADLSETHAIISAQRPVELQKKEEVDDSWIFVD